MQRAYAQNFWVSLVIVGIGVGILLFSQHVAVAGVAREWSEPLIARTEESGDSSQDSEGSENQKSATAEAGSRSGGKIKNQREKLDDGGERAVEAEVSETSVQTIENAELTEDSASDPVPEPVPTGELVTVAAVVDGDTIKLTSGAVVRYIGIDTPESTGGRLDCFGAEASRRNRELVLGKTVMLTKDVSETDRYGRLLRFVWLDSQLVNDQLVREGFAHASTFPPDVVRAEQFRAAEAEARAAGRGLWRGCPGGVTRPDYDPTVPQATTRDCPVDRPIKGNAQSKIFHLPSQRYYATTRPEACFATEAEARAAGYRKARI